MLVSQFSIFFLSFDGEPISFYIFRYLMYCISSLTMLISICKVCSSLLFYLFCFFTM